MIAGLFVIIFRKPLSKAILVFRGVQSNDKIDKSHEILLLIIGLGWIILPFLVLLGLIKPK